MQLVIVESPTKAKTISKFLPKEYLVTSSYGHVRDLPQKELGVDVEHDFEPKYVIPPKARPRIKELKSDLAKADSVILATDEDREGEAIAWHLAQALGLNEKQSKKSKIKNIPSQRIVFHEITKQAILAALEHPRDIDENLVNAQQARRVLDRLVGYKLSPFLWKKIFKGLSAGRVQSVAVRLIVDREREREKFNKQEYWSIEAKLKAQSEFIASLHAKDGKALDKFAVASKEDGEKILKELENAQWTVAHIERKETKRNSLPPFTTSTLQQAAWQHLHYQAKRTMMLAQNLYEHGFITYHRTDSLNIAQSALDGARDFIVKEYGNGYWPGAPRTFKTKSKGAQEAHEAIRPTDAARTEKDLGEVELAHRKLYALIRGRFLASQMTPAVFDATTVDIATGTPYGFRANGSVQKFDGFLRAYPMKFEENELPPLTEQEKLDLQELIPSQHFTQPPARYTDATLVKALELHGIGRPSTYAPILSTIQERNYVEKDEQKRFAPTKTGIMVNDLLVEHFPQVVDVEFTAHVEETLDGVAENKQEWRAALHEFYDPFAKLLEEKYETVKKLTPVEETSRSCPECGKPLLIRTGRFGRFLACSGFPACRYTETMQDEHASSFPEVICPKCGTGKVTEKRTKKRKIFYGCSAYPTCDFAVWYKPALEEKEGKHSVRMCPECGSALVQRRWGVVCSSKECKYKDPPKVKEQE